MPQSNLLKVKTANDAKSAKGLFLQNQQGVFPLCSSIILYKAGVRIFSVLLAILAVSLFSLRNLERGARKIRAGTRPVRWLITRAAHPVAANNVYIVLDPLDACHVTHRLLQQLFQIEGRQPACENHRAVYKFNVDRVSMILEMMMGIDYFRNQRDIARRSAGFD